MSIEIHPKVTLVGAGPGDPDLISVKGIRAVQSADAILYDALVSPEIISQAPETAELIYVGKRANKHRYDQSEINSLVVAYAFNYGHVVRLKGGDPFVFGRGQEEKDYAEAFNIPVEVIPGISSAISVPASIGIPVTARDMSDSFWVITATKRNGALSPDIKLAVRSNATIIILMGIRKLSQITECFIKEGKQDLPMAVIQNGTTMEERYVVGTAADIASRVKDAQIGTPGIIVAGDVVALHRDFGQSTRPFQLQEILQRYGK